MNRRWLTIGMTIGLLACAATVQATHGGLHGIRDSIGVTNDGWATLSWQDSGWTRCNAASQHCGSTTGYKTQRITCSATELDGTVSTVEERLCQNVVSAIGPKPRASRTCTRHWGRCPPPPPPPPPEPEPEPEPKPKPKPKPKPEPEPKPKPKPKPPKTTPASTWPPGGYHWPPPKPTPPKTTLASTGGIGYCGASVAVCQAYDDTFGRAPEVGPGPKFWDDWLIDHGVDTESQEFQKAFEGGCWGSDCDVLKDKKGEGL